MAQNLDILDLDIKWGISLNTQKTQFNYMTNCQECNHPNGSCDCFCCCSISKIGCPTCVVPVLAYRGIKKLIRKAKS